MIFSGSVRTHTQIFTSPICFPAAEWPQVLGGQLGCLGVTNVCLVWSLEASSILDLTGGWTATDRPIGHGAVSNEKRRAAVRGAGLEAGVTSHSVTTGSTSPSSLPRPSPVTGGTAPKATSLHRGPYKRAHLLHRASTPSIFFLTHYSNLVLRSL